MMKTTMHGFQNVLHQNVPFHAIFSMNSLQSPYVTAVFTPEPFTCSFCQSLRSNAWRPEAHLHEHLFPCVVIDKGLVYAKMSCLYSIQKSM